MMGRQIAQEELFYEFRLEDHVPSDHLLRQLDAILNFDRVRLVLTPRYSQTGRPSIDPELMLRMLLIGYAYGIRSERRLCSEVHLNLAYRWFCRLGLDGVVPDHSTFSKNRYGRFARATFFACFLRMWSDNAEAQDWWAVRALLLMEPLSEAMPDVIGAWKPWIAFAEATRRGLCANTSTHWMPATRFTAATLGFCRRPILLPRGTPRRAGASLVISATIWLIRITP